MAWRMRSNGSARSSAANGSSRSASCCAVGIAVRRHGEPVVADGELVQMRADLLGRVDAPNGRVWGGRVERVAKDPTVFLRSSTSVTGEAAYSRTHSARSTSVHTASSSCVALGQQGLADLFAVEIGVQRRAKQDLLRPIGFDRRGAVEFERPTAGVEDQLAADQPMLFVFENRQKAQGRWRAAVASCHMGSLEWGSRLAGSARRRSRWWRERARGMVLELHRAGAMADFRCALPRYAMC